jgi:hypothetical protein
VVNEYLRYPLYSVCISQRCANKVNVLENVKLWSKHQALFSYEICAEKLVPNVTRSTLENIIGELIF